MSALEFHSVSVVFSRLIMEADPPSGVDPAWKEPHLKLRAASILIAFGFASQAIAADGSAIMQRVVKPVENPMVASETWEILREDLTDRTMFLDGEKLMYFGAPKAAFDAGAVPISIRQRRSTGERITELMIIIDENPAPLAAKFTLGELIGDLYLESRVRYDQPSNVRVIAMTDNDKAYMVGRFVQAAGGCVSSANNDPLAALEHMGQMKLRQFSAKGGMGAKASGDTREVQLMIRHPNFTGMQTLPSTGELIETRFIDSVEVRLGDELLFHMTGGFSISENPSFRFSFIENGAQALTVRATDTSGAVFQRTFGLAPGT